MLDFCSMDLFALSSQDRRLIVRKPRGSCWGFSEMDGLCASELLSNLRDSSHGLGQDYLSSRLQWFIPHQLASIPFCTQYPYLQHIIPVSGILETFRLDPGYPIQAMGLPAVHCLCLAGYVQLLVADDADGWHLFEIWWDLIPSVLMRWNMITCSESMACRLNLRLGTDLNCGRASAGNSQLGSMGTAVGCRCFLKSKHKAGQAAP